ncbi:hypothetical protein KKE54_02105 [bacterium]|nr:hypothetical protein [bacterium]
MGSAIYGILIVFIHKYAPIPPSITDIETLNTIEYASVVYVLGFMVIANVMRKKMLASDSILTKKQSTKAESDEPPFIANYLTTLFIIWALIEAITFGGVVLFLTSAKLMIPLVMITIGVLFKLANGPRLEELMQLAAKQNAVALRG